MSNIATMPTTPKPQTSKEVIAANVQLLVEQLEAGHSEGLDVHPRYNPERDGRGGIKGGCSTCFSLYDRHQARLMLDAAHHEFLRKAIPWTRSIAPRSNSQTNSNPDVPGVG